VISVLIRPETAADRADIRALNERAFEGPVEAKLVDLLRAAGKARVSLVAILDDRVVGHILFSSVTIDEAPAGLRAAGLAPMSVLPEFQNRGIGSQLVREGLVACRELGFDLIVVLGHIHYYPRFGFQKASDHGLTSEYDAGDAFMVLPLKDGALEGVRGLAQYAKEFGDV
jgi:putative acetyltransferase